MFCSFDSDHSKYIHTYYTVHSPASKTLFNLGSGIIVFFSIKKLNVIQKLLIKFIILSFYKDLCSLLPNLLPSKNGDFFFLTYVCISILFNYCCKNYQEKCQTRKTDFCFIHIVREYKGWVRNVALIKCILDPGKPKRGWNSGREGTGAR